jgi:hypothetical protein
MAHACNPRYSRGRDQEYRGLMPSQANRPYLKKRKSETLSRKKKNHQKGLVEWLEVYAVSSNTSTAKTKCFNQSMFVYNNQDIYIF